MKLFRNRNLKPCVRVIILFLVLLALAGCFPRIDPRWSSIDKSTRVPQAVQLKACQLLRARADELHSLRALSELNLDSESGLQSVRLALLFEAPHRVRIEVLPHGAALAIFLASSTDSGTLLLEPTKKKAVRIAESQELTARLIKIRIAPQDLAYILAARIPPRYLDKLCSLPQSDSSTAMTSVEFIFATDGPGVTIYDYDAGQYWTLNMGSGLLRTALLRRVSDEWPVLAADFIEDDFADPKQLYPAKVNIVLGNQALFAELRSSLVKFNQKIPTTLFDVKIPAGYTIEDK